MDQAYGCRAVALAGEIERTGIIEPDHRRDIAAGIMNRVILAQRAQEERPVRDAETPLGADERRHHPRVAERAAGGTIEMANDFRNEIEPLDRREAPDEIILRLPGARHLRAQLQRADRDIVDGSFAVAPGDAAGIFQQLGAAPFERQAGGRDEAAHPGAEQVVRANHAAATIGHRNRDVVVIHRLTQHRPVGRHRLARDGCREQPAREDHPARGDRKPGKKADRQNRIARRPEQQRGGQQRQPADHRFVELRQARRG